MNKGGKRGRQPATISSLMKRESQRLSAMVKYAQEPYKDIYLMDYKGVQTLVKKVNMKLIAKRARSFLENLFKLEGRCNGD